MARDCKKMSVMLVDDNESTNFFNEIAIKRVNKNVDVSIATNGKQALELVSYLEEMKKSPDIIFLDINMPFLNGIDFLEAYLRSSFFVKMPKIVFTLSTEIQEKDLKKLKELEIPYTTSEKMLQKNTLDKYLNDFVGAN